MFPTTRHRYVLRIGNITGLSPVAWELYACKPHSRNHSSLSTPIIGPQHGLLELKQFVDDSQTSLRIQLYQMQDAYLVQALLDALQRGSNRGDNARPGMLQL